MEEKEFKRFIIPVLILILGVLSFLVVRPLGAYILFGLLLSYIFYSSYQKVRTKINSPDLSALIVVITSFVVFVIPPLLLLPLFIRQLFESYLSLRGADFSLIVFKLFPSLASSPAISAEVIASMSHFNSNLSALLLSLFESIFQNIPEIILGLVVLLFTFYFGLREGAKFKEYISVLLPVAKDAKKTLYEKFEKVTDSVLFGHLIIGIAAGIIAGIGYFMFGVPNALLLTVATILVSIVPVVGAWFIWIPVDLFLFINGDNVAGMQLLIYGLFVINWVETFLRPVVIAERSEMNAAISIIGAMGGIYAFGLIGFILGPLILAYLILLIELYKQKQTESIVIREEKIPAIP